MSLALSTNTILENAGTNAVTLTVRRLNTDIASPLVVPLNVDLPGNLTIPSQITIPANQAQRVITLAAIDDNLLDGPQQVTITASPLAICRQAPNLWSMIMKSYCLARM